MMYLGNKEKNCISLIGMPGAGKSTVGIVLAKQIGLDFIDTDILIQNLEQRSLQDIVDRDGYQQLRKIEEKIILSLEIRNSVISTGGSAVYSHEGMTKLGKFGPRIYLKLDLQSLKERVTMAPARGIASEAGKSFQDIFDERTPLYEDHSDFVIDAGAGTADVLAKDIIDLIS